MEYCTRCVYPANAKPAIIFDEDGAHSHKPFPPMAPRPCIFEYIYFSRPDSIIGGRSVLIENCRIYYYSNNGIDFEPVGGMNVMVVNTTI